MSHNFGRHLGITAHLEKIYGAPSFESWCDIKTKVKGGKKLGINSYPQSHMYLLMQQVKVWGFRNTANNYHGGWSKFILLKAVCSKKTKTKTKLPAEGQSCTYGRGINFSFVCVSLCPIRLPPREQERFCNLRYLSGATHVYFPWKDWSLDQFIHWIDYFSNHNQSSSLSVVT